MPQGKLRAKSDLRVSYFGIQRVTAPKGAGGATQDGLEQAATAIAQRIGARTVRVSVENPANPKWREFLEARGYKKEIVAHGSTGFFGTLWTRVFSVTQ